MGEAEETFRCFVGARLPALKRAAWLLTGDVHLAEDLVQTALAKVAMRWERVAAGGDPEPYVRKVLYHEHVSAGRKRRFVEVLGGHGAEQAIGADTTAVVPLRLTMRQALARLTPKQRAVLVLRYYEDLSESQAAELLNVSVGTVRSQTRAALARLRAVAPELATVLEVTRD
jgi:RNA polymerase sigma-70 factor (sigma-E family)